MEPTVFSTFAEGLAPLAQWLLVIAGAGMGISALVIVVRAGWGLVSSLLDTAVDDYHYGDNADEYGDSSESGH